MIIIPDNKDTVETVIDKGIVADYGIGKPEGLKTWDQGYLIYL